MLKLPIAWIAGVRLKSLSDAACITRVSYRWINTNPFGSMYFAVQAMAAELSTGALVLSMCKNSGTGFSMLVVSHHAAFMKKAKGKITFTCNDGRLISETITEAIQTSSPRTMSLRSTGTDESGATVCEMEFKWSIKPR